MSARAALTRLTIMGGEELRFRVACEMRKLGGRFRYAVRPARLRRRQLARILDPASGPLVADAVRAARAGNFVSAHRALAGHIQTRASRWPLRASRRARIVEVIRREYPDAVREAERRADRMIDGRHDLLGHRDVQLGHPPDWHADAVHGRRAPLEHWTRVSYLDPALGDHKVIWELNRHQYWLELGTAYWLTGERQYRDAFVAHFCDWLGKNPPFEGINWTSMLELAFRALSWTWAVELFGGEADPEDAPWLVDLFVSLDCQLTHISQNLSTYFSPNTHLTGEALALYAVSTAFPELLRSPERAAQGRAILIREASRQIAGDGGHAELSAHYHRYTTDFYLLALMVARASGDPVAPLFENAARRLSAYLRTIADDNGVMPLIGDDDGGQLFRFSGRRPADASPTLSAAASLLGSAALAVGPPPVEAAWILGRRPDAQGVKQAWSSRALRDSGYFVSRSSNGSRLIFDAGPHGYLNGGHAHADALAVVLTVCGEPLLVDPGTATYVMDARMRDLMRSSRMHNTVVLDGREHSTPRGPFQWATRTDARLLAAHAGEAWDFAVGVHHGYQTALHERSVLTMHDIGWLIVDRITGDGPMTADVWWHLHPDWCATLRDGLVALQSRSGRRLALATTASDVVIVADPSLTAYSPEYGRVEQGTAIRAREAGAGSLVVATFFPVEAAASESITLTATTVEDAGAWVTHGLAIAIGRREIHVRLPLSRHPGAEPPAGWPQPCIEQLAQSCVE